MVRKSPWVNIFLLSLSLFLHYLSSTPLCLLSLRTSNSCLFVDLWRFESCWEICVCVCVCLCVLSQRLSLITYIQPSRPVINFSLDAPPPHLLISCTHTHKHTHKHAHTQTHSNISTCLCCSCNKIQTHTHKKKCTHTQRFTHSLQHSVMLRD